MDDPQELIKKIHREHRARVANIVIASDTPFEIGQMFPYAGERFRIVCKLTRKQFERELEKNFEARKRDGWGDHLHKGILAQTGAGRTDGLGWSDGPSAAMTYYYALERLGDNLPVHRNL